MNVSARRGVFKRVLIDLNTQCDFLLPRGALPVANREQIVSNIRRIMSWARLQCVPVVSSLDAHRADESPNGLPRHCVDNTAGQRKLPFTLLPRRVLLHGDNTFDVPLDPFRRYNQLIFTKRTRDFLSNPKADRLINEIDARCFVLFGVITEHCIKAASLGLMARGRHVAVVTDACGHWSRPDAELALRQIEAKGAVMITSDELISGAADARLDAAPQRPMYVEEEEEAAPVNGKQPPQGAILLSRDRFHQDGAEDPTPEPANVHARDNHAANGNGKHGGNGNGKHAPRRNGRNGHAAPAPKSNGAKNPPAHNGPHGPKRAAPLPRPAPRQRADTPRARTPGR